MRVPRLPVFDRQDLTQSHLGFERRFRIHELPSVTDAVDMHINTDSRKVEADRYSQIRGLASDARQFAQLFDSIRQNAAELLLQHSGQRFQMAGLVAIEPDWIYELLDFIHRQPLEISRTEHLTLCGGEQPSHCPGGALILRASRKDRANQNAERIMRLRLDEFNDWSGMCLEFLLQRPVNGWNVSKGHPTSPFRTSSGTDGNPQEADYGHGSLP